MLDERPRAPFPGSPRAVEAGCACPPVENRNGEFARTSIVEGEPRRAWWVEDECPLHGPRS